MCKLTRRGLQRHVGSAGESEEECFCKEGAFSLQAMPGTECFSCPSGAECLGFKFLPNDTSVNCAPYPERGYWGDPQYPTLFHPCHPRHWCEGGEEFACKQGHTSGLCTQCMQGYFSVGASCIR